MIFWFLFSSHCECDAMQSRKFINECGLTTYYESDAHFTTEHGFRWYMAEWFSYFVLNMLQEGQTNSFHTTFAVWCCWWCWNGGCCCYYALLSVESLESTLHKISFLHFYAMRCLRGAIIYSSSSTFAGYLHWLKQMINKRPFLGKSVCVSVFFLYDRML